jgi:hypothetical protein
MPSVRVEMDSAGFKAILSGPEVEGLLRKHAEAIAAAAGPGHVVDIIQGGYGGGRKVAIIATDTVDAMIAEATDRNLTRALDAGR